LDFFESGEYSAKIQSLLATPLAGDDLEFVELRAENERLQSLSENLTHEIEALKKEREESKLAV